MKSIKQKATDIFRNRKIEWVGSSPIREVDFFEVAGVLIEHKEGEFKCTCKDCSVKRIPNDLEPRCCYVEALKIYLKNEEMQEL